MSQLDGLISFCVRTQCNIKVSGKHGKNLNVELKGGTWKVCLHSNYGEGWAHYWSCCSDLDETEIVHSSDELITLFLSKTPDASWASTFVDNVCHPTVDPILVADGVKYYFKKGKIENKVVTTPK